MSTNKLIQSGVDRVVALENELAIVRAELAGLQSARSVRIAKFLRQLIVAKPNEISKTLKQLPELVKRYEPPQVEILSASESYFSSAHNPLPLFAYPNVNVATIGKFSAKFFNVTCNSFTIGTQTHKLLSKYNAVHLVAVHAKAYDSKRHKELVSQTLANGSKLLVIYTSEDECIAIRKDFPKKGTYLIESPDPSPTSFGTHIDIYSLRVMPPAISGSKVIYDTVISKSIPRNTIVVLNDEFIKKESQAETLFARKLNTLIASGTAVVLHAKARPSWISPDVLLCASETALSETLAQLAKPYTAERYALRCSRDTILRFNAKVLADHVLTVTGVIEEPKNDKPSIGVILSTRRPENIAHALSQLEQQTIQPSQVALMLHGVSDTDYKKAQEAIKKSRLNIIERRVDQSVIFGDVLNQALETLTTDFATKIDDDDYYGPNHFLDLYSAHLHSRADFVGKWNNWVYLVSEDKTINWVPENSNAYVKHLPGGTFLVKTAVLKQLRFGIVPRAIDSELFRRAERRGATLYSTYRYNYVRQRGDDHTYNATNADFKSRAHAVQLDGLPLNDELYI
jgi:hypothetical protein